MLRVMIVLILCITDLTTGCATVTTGTEQNITIITEKM